jgi:hypothetical protein
MFRHEDEQVRVKLKDRAGPRRGILAEARKTTHILISRHGQRGLDSLINPATPREACGTSRLAS